MGVWVSSEEYRFLGFRFVGTLARAVRSQVQPLARCLCVARGLLFGFSGR